MVKDNQAVESDWKHTKDEFDTFVVCADDKQAELIVSIFLKVISIVGLV